MRKIKKLVRKNKKLLLRLLAFGVALEVVLMAALLIDIPRGSQAWYETAAVGQVLEEAPLAQNTAEYATDEVEGSSAEEEELAGAGLDDSMFVDPVDTTEGTDLALDENMPTPEPYDFNSDFVPYFEDNTGSYPATDNGTGGSSYDEGYPIDDGEGNIGADFDDYGDTSGCDGDCDDYSTPTDPTQPVLPTLAPPANPTTAPPQPEPTAVPPTAAPPAQPTQPEPLPTATTEPVKPTKPDAAGGLVAVPAAGAPVLDGQGSDAAWASAPELTIDTTGGANDSAARVTIRSVYDNQRVYFLVSWEDPTNSWLRNPWEKQPDGSWKLLIGSDNEGNDENEFYEDKLALLWPINDSIPGFDSEGCGTACHLGEGSDEKPLGSMHTNRRGEIADLWNWKAFRNIAQVDDLYVNNDNYKDDYWAGFQTDPSDGGGYSSNITESKDLPAFMPPGGGDRSGWPSYIYAPEKVTLDDSLFTPGDRLPSAIAEPFLGDRGDIEASWTYENGRWTMEFSRALVTGSKYDVQFEDLDEVYYFGLATFDNTQIRHAVQAGATPFSFQK